MLERSGVWQIAPLDGLLVGLSFNEAKASLPDGLERDFTRRLLLIAEGRFVAAFNDRVRKAAENA